ncbi:MAG: hypothetical protein ABI548_01990 [Polyangiaceae bacterium]
MRSTLMAAASAHARRRVLPKLVADTATWGAAVVGCTVSVAYALSLSNSC